MTGCAHVEAPQGGPEDKTPPQIAGVYPAPLSTSVDRQTEIHLRFTEWVQEPVPATALRFSPPIREGLDIEPHGDYVILKLREPLDSATTYSLLITRDLRDLRNNPLKAPFPLVFSTGPQLDSLTVSGKLQGMDEYTSQFRNTPVIVLYPMGAVRNSLNHLQDLKDSVTGQIPEQPDLSRESGYYLTTPDSTGVFNFSGLKAGKYRMAAFFDVNGNLQPDIQNEVTALGELDIELDSLKPARDQYLKLTNMDTSWLSFLSVQPAGENRVSLEFSRGVADSLLVLNNFTLINPDSTLAEPEYLWKNPRTGAPVLMFDTLIAGRRYEITARNLIDTLGNPLDTASARVPFTWVTQLPDSLVRKRLAQVTPRAGSESVFPGDTITIHFEPPVLPATDTLYKEMFLLTYSGDTADFELLQKDPATWYVIPETMPTDADIVLQMGEPDTVDVPVLAADTLAADTLVADTFMTDTLLPENANTEIFADTNAAVQTRKEVRWRRRTITSFATVSRMKWASLQGQFPVGDARVQYTLTHAISKKQWTSRALNDGSFTIDSLVEGPYFFSWFRDVNENQKWDPGQITPFAHAEPWRSVSDTLFIRRGSDNLLDSLAEFVPPLPEN